MPSKARSPSTRARDGLEIQVVGRLVEDEEVGLLRDDPAEHESRGLAARQRSDGLVDVLAGEQHAPELPAHVRRALAGTGLPRRSRSGVIAASQQLVVVLGEVPDVDLVPEADLARVRRRGAHRRS